MFGGEKLLQKNTIEAQGKLPKSAHEVSLSPAEDSLDSLDAQDLLIEVSKLRRQVQVVTEKERRTQEENDDLKRQVLVLKQQQEEVLESHGRLESILQEAAKVAAKQADIDADVGMRGLQAGQEGYLEAKVQVLEGYLNKAIQRSHWLQAQTEQAKDMCADAKLRQVNAEAQLAELIEGGGFAVDANGNRLSASMATRLSSALPTGSDIWKDEKSYAEGLPKSIPSRAARCAALVTTALANGQSMRSTGGRTVATTAGPTVAPTARPGNVWATLMNGGAAGARVDFA